MPALKPTEFYGEVVWLGIVPTDAKDIASVARTKLDLTLEGVFGEKHSGLIRQSCSRVLSQHPRGTDIRNTRQLSVVSAEEIEATAATMGIDRIAPEQVGATLILRGIPDFTHIPPSSRLQGPSGVTLIVDMENRPCHLPSKGINETHPGEGGKYKSAAKGRRGVTVSVERAGSLAIGESLRLHIPDQPVWAHLGHARGG